MRRAVLRIVDRVAAGGRVGLPRSVQPLLEKGQRADALTGVGPDTLPTSAEATTATDATTVNVVAATRNAPNRSIHRKLLDVVESGECGLAVELTSHIRRETLYAQLHVVGPRRTVLVGVGGITRLIHALEKARDELVAHEAAQAARAKGDR